MKQQMQIIVKWESWSSTEAIWSFSRVTTESLSETKTGTGYEKDCLIGDI